MSRLVDDRWPTLLVVASCVGLAAANWIAAPAATTFVAALLCLAVALATQPDGRRVASLGMALALVGLAWGVVRLDALERSTLASRVGEIGSARVIVTGPPHSTPFAVRMPVDVRLFDGVTVRERALLELRPGRSPPRGAVLEIVRARLVAPRGPETGFDERAWLARRGIHVVVRADDAQVVARRGGIGGVADRLRAHVEATLAAGTAGERLALLRGFVLGDDDGLDDDLQQAFRASGLAHMTAVSGQNVVIVAAAVASLPWLLGIGRLGVHLAAIAGILGYAFAVGWEPSVVRASVAGCVTSVAWLASRANDRWHALALGALVLLVWQPTSLLEPGFQLSFAAVAAILLVLPYARRLADGYPVSESVAIGVCLPVACSLATAPISWLHFGAVPLWSVPANIAAEPAMPVVLSLSLAAAAVALLLPAAAVPLVWLAGWAAWWIASCARVVASLPHAQIRSTAAVCALGVLVCGCLALPYVVRRLSKRGRTTLGAATLVVVSVGLVTSPWSRDRPSWTTPAGLRVTFVDVGQGDGILLETSRAAILVDEGPPEARMADQLRSMGVRSLSAMVLTHPQRDHVGGAADVLRRLRVGVVLHPGIPSESTDERAALDEAGRRGVPVRVIRRGDSFRLGRLVIRVLWPDGPGAPGDDPNNHAVVLLATFGATDVLLTADAESDVTGSLPLRQVEVLKVAHHGSEDSGLGRELRVLRPQVAVISVGEGNDYGHPRAETLSALRDVPGLRLYRTDTDGRVVLETNGRTLRVSSEG